MQQYTQLFTLQQLQQNSQHPQQSQIPQQPQQPTTGLAGDMSCHEEAAIQIDKKFS